MEPDSSSSARAIGLSVPQGRGFIAHDKVEGKEPFLPFCCRKQKPGGTWGPNYRLETHLKHSEQAPRPESGGTLLRRKRGVCAAGLVRHTAVSLDGSPTPGAESRAARQVLCPAARRTRQNKAITRTLRVTRSQFHSIPTAGVAWERDRGAHAPKRGTGLSGTTSHEASGSGVRGRVDEGPGGRDVMADTAIDSIKPVTSQTSPPSRFALPSKNQNQNGN